MLGPYGFNAYKDHNPLPPICLTNPTTLCLSFQLRITLLIVQVQSWFSTNSDNCWRNLKACGFQICGLPNPKEYTMTRTTHNILHTPLKKKVEKSLANEITWRLVLEPHSTQKHISTNLQKLKWVWPSMNRFTMFFVQTSTRLQRMHLKLTKHGRFCKHKQPTPYQTHVELKDNSIVWTLSMKSLKDLMLIL